MPLNVDLHKQYNVGTPDGENLLFHQSWLNQLPLLIAFAVLEAAVIYLSMRFPEHTSLTLGPESVPLSVSYLTILPVLVLMWAAFKILNERLVLTPKYMIHVIGRLSWRERTVRLEYSHIQEIEIAHSIPQRLLGLGDLIIKPVGGREDNSIHVHGLRNPRAVKDVVRSLRELPEGAPVP